MHTISHPFPSLELSSLSPSLSHLFCFLFSLSKTFSWTSSLLPARARLFSLTTFFLDFFPTLSTFPERGVIFYLPHQFPHQLVHFLLDLPVSFNLLYYSYSFSSPQSLLPLSLFLLRRFVWHSFLLFQRFLTIASVYTSILLD
jgi:hypothetical protein